MTTFRSEETLVALIGLAVVPWAAWTIRRGLREEKLPIGRAYVRRDERPGAFRMLLGFYAVAALLVAFVAVDLLLDIKGRL
jgi:hypothetical protein